MNALFELSVEIYGCAEKTASLDISFISSRTKNPKNPKATKTQLTG